MDFPKSGTIYIYDKSRDGRTHVVEVEETPEDINSLVPKWEESTKEQNSKVNPPAGGQNSTPKIVPNLQPQPKIHQPTHTENSKQSSINNQPAFTKATAGEAIKQSDSRQALDQMAHMPIKPKPAFSPFGQFGGNNPFAGNFNKPASNFGQFNKPTSPFKPFPEAKPFENSKVNPPAGGQNPLPAQAGKFQFKNQNLTPKIMPNLQQATGNNLQSNINNEPVRSWNNQAVNPTPLEAVERAPYLAPITQQKALEQAPVVSKPELKNEPLKPTVTVPKLETNFQPTLRQAQAKQSETHNMQPKSKTTNMPWSRTIGILLLAFALGGIIGPLLQPIKLESAYTGSKIKQAIVDKVDPKKPELPPSVPVIFEPLIGPDGKEIKPVNTEFSIIIPKVGINSAITENVNPANTSEYNLALEKSVAHSSTSYTPDKDGTVYLFSHSTNYDWFVKDLNAVFYLVKNLNSGDMVVLYYKGIRYTYSITHKEVVKPTDISYLIPQSGQKSLILQTCWPPGSTTERLLLFADLIEERTESI